MITNTIRKKKHINDVTRRASISKGKSGNYRKKTMKNRKMNMNQTKRGGSLAVKKGNKSKRNRAKKLARGLSDDAKRSGNYEAYKEGKDKYDIESLNTYFKDTILKDDKFDLFPNVNDFKVPANIGRVQINDYKEFLRRIINKKQVTSGMLSKKITDALGFNETLVNFWSDETKVFNMTDDGSHNTLVQDYNDKDFYFDDAKTIKGLNMRDFQVFRNAYIQHIIAKILKKSKSKVTTKGSLYNELKEIASASNVKYLAEILGNYYGKFYFSNQNENHLQYKNVLGLILRRYIKKDSKRDVIKYKNHIAETKYSNELSRMLYYIFSVDTDDTTKDDEIRKFLECFQKSADAAAYDNTENVFTHYRSGILNRGGCRSKAKFAKDYSAEFTQKKKDFVQEKTNSVADLENRIAGILQTFNTKTSLNLNDIKDALSIFSDDNTFLSIYPKAQFNDYIRSPVKISPEEFLKNVVEKTNVFFDTVTDKVNGEAIRKHVIDIHDNEIGTIIMRNDVRVKDHINSELEKCTNEFLFEDKFFVSFGNYFDSVKIDTSYVDIGKKIDECTTMLKKLHDVHKDATKMKEKFKDSNLKENMEKLIKYLIDANTLTNFVNNKKIDITIVVGFTNKVNEMLTVTDIDDLKLQIAGVDKDISNIKNNELKIAIDKTELNKALSERYSTQPPPPSGLGPHQNA